MIVTLIWGGTFASTKLLLATMDPMCLLAWRFGSAALIFLLLFGRRLARDAGRTLGSATNLRQGIVLGALLYGGFALQTLGLRSTSSSRSGFITALYVIITPLLQILVTRRAPGRNVTYGIVLVLVGLWGLTAPGGEARGLIEPWQQGGFGIGDLLTLGCAAIFAVYIIVLDRMRGPAGPEALTAVQLLTTGACCTAHALIGGEWSAPVGVVGWGHLIFLSLFASVLATYWQTRYQRDTMPARAAIIYSLESLFAAIIGIVALGEHLGPVGIAGGALIFTGLLVVELKRA